ncbi:MAG TPA: cytochrome c-type biogenesis protein CcmH [Solirubrobacteraceae bacterium]|nr:cytochrome c-type biogenesis protein CcmH [Solirubrobacteraceae bacterium]
MRRALAAAVLALLALAPAASADVSMPAIERQVMCVTCKIPLMVAESTQANREREYIRKLIARGDSEAEIRRELVAQYGPAVLALPQASGFGLAAYLVPAAVVLAGALLLVALVPRWRRRAPATAAQAPRMSDEDSERLDADIAQIEG